MTRGAAHGWHTVSRGPGFVLLVGAWLLLATAPGFCPFGKKPASSGAVVVPSAPEAGRKPQFQEVPNPRFASPPGPSGKGGDEAVPGGASGGGAPGNSLTRGGSTPPSSGEAPANLPPTPVPRASPWAPVEAGPSPVASTRPPGDPGVADQGDDVVDDLVDDAAVATPVGGQGGTVPAMADRARHDALPRPAGPVEVAGRSAPNFLGMPLKQQDTRGPAGRATWYVVGSLAALALLVLVMRGGGQATGGPVVAEKPSLLLPDFQGQRAAESEALQAGVEPRRGESAPEPPAADTRH